MMDNFKRCYEKPPLGLKPNKYWVIDIHRDRQFEIIAAIERYLKAGKIIPEEWITEFKLNNEILASHLEAVHLDIAEKDVEKFKEILKNSKLEVL